MGNPTISPADFIARGMRAQAAVDRALTEAQIKLLPAEEQDREWAKLRRQNLGQKPRRAPGRRKEAAPVELTKLQLEARVVVAFDSAIGSLGWAVMELGVRGPIRRGSGTWGPSAAKAAPPRFQQLRSFVADKVRTNNIPGRTLVIAELPNTGGLRRGKGFAQRSVISYGRAIGNIEAAAAAIVGDVLVILPTVEQWKGKLKKAYTMGFVRAMTDTNPGDDNEADALGLCLWFFDKVGGKTR